MISTGMMFINSRITNVFVLLRLHTCVCDNVGVAWTLIGGSGCGSPEKYYQSINQKVEMWTILHIMAMRSYLSSTNMAPPSFATCVIFKCIY
nr:hypothetical protein [Tanacetum cinerariifolium]